MGHILLPITIGLDHAKRDSRLTAYGGVVLQQLEGLEAVETHRAITHQNRVRSA